MCFFILFQAAKAIRVASIGGDASEKVPFVGSSIIRFWGQRGLEASFPGLPVSNRGVGGWQTQDVLDHFERVTGCAPGRAPPKLIVYYCGSNDLLRGHGPRETAARVREFAERLPQETRLIIISSLRSPDRASWALAPGRRVFVDVNCVLEGHSPYFRWDGIHLTSAGYAAMASVLRPVVEQEWAAAAAGGSVAARPAPVAALDAAGGATQLATV
jgi:hypothetical protein